MTMTVFKLTQKPIGPNEIRLENDNDRFAIRDFGRAIEVLQSTFDNAKAAFEKDGALANPSNTARELAYQFDQATYAFKTSGVGDYQTSNRIEALEQLQGEIVDFLAGVVKQQTSVSTAYNSEKKDMVGRLTRQVRDGLRAAFFEGIREVTSTMKGPEKIESWSEWNEYNQYLVNGFDAVLDPKNYTSKQKLKLEVNDLYKQIKKIGSKPLAKWSGYSEPGEIMAALITKVGESDGDQFNESAERLLTFMNPDSGIAYGQIREIGVRVANEWQKVAKERSLEVDEIAYKLKSARLDQLAKTK